MRALRLRSNTILFGAILIGSAAATSSWAAEAAEAARGFAFASAHCAQCHGLDDKAPSPNPGAPSFPEIGRRRDPDGLPALLGQVTREGHYAMPRRRTTAADRRSLAAYIAEATERSDRR